MLTPFRPVCDQRGKGRGEDIVLSSPGLLWRCVAAAAALLSTADGARAESVPTVAPIEVTATRIPEPADQAPAFITILEGPDLRARHVSDLRTALALVAGVQAPSGGDPGPGSAVPSFWGLHEFDAFLLVVDGVPLGGAFNPAVPDLNLSDVERIEVLKGAAPVIYGATSFVGVIQVIHYPAGQAANEVTAGYGSYGSWRGSASFALPTIAGVQQSIAVDAKRDGFADPRETVGQVQVLYRAAGTLAGGQMRLDADITLMKSVPTSPVEREGAALTLLTPLDANYNPADAKINEDHYHLVLAYSHTTPLGDWDTTASLAYSHIVDIRGFLRPDLINADSQNQGRDIDDDYLDSHFTTLFGRDVSLTWGADLLYGRGTQASFNGSYAPSLTGSARPPPTTALHVDEINGLYDQRIFTGQYLQGDWKVGSLWDFNGGLRVNETHEHKTSTHIDGFDSGLSTFDDRTQSLARLSGAAGASYKAWRSGADEAVIFADYRNTFKPAAIDFGPDNTPAILKPETASSYELGLKGRLAGGRFSYQTGLFVAEFSNLVVATTDSAGHNLLQNAGGERLKGLEAEAQWRVSSPFSLSAAVSWHDARFAHYIAAEGGTNINVSGNQLTLAPHLLTSVGVIYSAPTGLFGSATLNYAGSSYLDLANRAVSGAYFNLDASLGYRWARYSLALNAYNLGGNRAPVTQSEFGDQSYYLASPRTLFIDATATF